MVLLSQGTKSETLDRWDYGDDYMHNTDDGGPISIMHEDVGTVLGVQAVVKFMLDDVIGGQQIQKQQLSDILHSGTLPSNRTSVSPPTSPRTSTPRRDMDMAMLENLVEELQRNTSHPETLTTSVPSNTSDTLTLHKPHGRLYHKEDPDLQLGLLVRRGDIDCTEQRGERIERCGYLRKMSDSPHLELRMY